MKYHTIRANDTIRDVTEIMNKKKIDFCVCKDNKNRLIGIFTLGDFRRAVFFKINLNEKVGKIINKKYIFLRSKNLKKVNKLFQSFNVDNIPIIKDGKLIKIINRNEFYKKVFKTKDSINNPVIIMAGGKGTRLDPFTRVLPKPLIPINNEPIIKKIMDEFCAHGIKNFNITLNDKANVIKGFFYENNFNYKINFIKEKKPLGTAGSLRFFLDKYEEPIFVTNCDIIIKEKYKDILEFHKKKGCDITVVAATKDFSIPYGVCKINRSAILKNIDEKPSFNYLVNTGFYIINPKVIRNIPKNKYFDMDELLRISKNKKLKVKVFPISENNWLDIGQWSEYQKTLKEIKKF
tara:strand:+ start:4894 stop:5940 length:1047 start_codon:yes stop_codon:yes gene_type:complete